MPKRRDPRERFEQDAPPRAAAVVKGIRALRKLAGPGGAPEQWDRIFEAWEDEIRKLRDLVRELPAAEQIDLFGARGTARAHEVIEQMRERASALAPAGTTTHSTQTPTAPSGAPREAAPAGSSAS